MLKIAQTFVSTSIPVLACGIISCQSDDFNFSNGQVPNFPNFILINLDDAGHADFSFTGAEGYQTPNIDRLANEGMIFNNYYVSQPISGASRAGLMTGCYPNRIGFNGAPGPNCPYGINSSEETIAEVVKKQNYATAIFGKWHLGNVFKFLPLQHGFDEWYGLPYSNDMWPYHPTIKFPDLPSYEGNLVLGYNFDQSNLTSYYTERSIKFIKKNKDRPFFLYLAHSMPHVPLAVSSKFKGKSQKGLYGDVMMELDWSVGKIIKTLKELNLERNTLIIFTSDNGPWISYGNHAGSTGGLREAKATTFNGGLKVVCIAYWKGVVPQGTICNRLTSNIDFLPTFADLSGAALPKNKIDGKSLKELLKNPNAAPVHDALCFYYRVNDLEAITDGRFKLIFPHKYRHYTIPGNNGRPGKLSDKVVNEEELYDLQNDINEKYNVIKQYPDEVKKLEKLADEYRQDLGDDLRGIKGNGRRKPGYK